MTLLAAALLWLATPGASLGAALTASPTLPPVAVGGPVRQPPVYFTGATIGMSVRSGLAHLGEGAADGRLGYSFGVSGRLTSALFLGDVEVAYGVARFSSTVAGTAVDLTRQSLAVTLQLHPLFLLALQNTWFGYVLAGSHVDIGGSLEVSTVSQGGGESATRGDPAWHWGLGIDFPLGDPNRGRTWWLGLRFRQTLLRSDLAQALTRDLGDRQFLVTVGHYWNWK